MKTYKHLFAIGLIAMLMSVTGLSSVPASAATTRTRVSRKWTSACRATLRTVHLP